MLPIRGMAAFDIGKKSVVTSPMQGAVVDCQLNDRIVLTGPRAHLVVVIDPAMLRSRLIDLLDAPVSYGLDFVPEIDLTKGAGTAIKHAAAALHAGLVETAILREAPLATANLINAILDLMVGALPHRFSGQLLCGGSPTPWHVKRAVDFMRAHLASPLSLQDIARAAGVGSRTLQEGFQRFKMTTPMAYLQHLRLDSVHQELLDPERSQTVTATALKWGFTHMGRFSAEYRVRFGTTPSHTLRSARKNCSALTEPMA